MSKNWSLIYWRDTWMKRNLKSFSTFNSWHLQHPCQDQNSAKIDLTEATNPTNHKYHNHMANLCSIFHLFKSHFPAAVPPIKIKWGPQEHVLLAQNVVSEDRLTDGSRLSSNHWVLVCSFLLPSKHVKRKVTHIQSKLTQYRSHQCPTVNFSLCSLKTSQRSGK